jgi:hypothetical protein
MTVQQVIDGLKVYPPDLPVKFFIPWDPGKPGARLSIDSFNVEYEGFAKRYESGKWNEPIAILLQSNQKL